MNKGRIIKTVVATSALVVLTSMTVFGKIITKSEKLGSGIMYLSGDTASSLKKAEAGTKPQIGSGDTSIKHDWEYADGYSSIHKMIRNGLGYANGSLSY